MVVLEAMAHGLPVVVSDSRYCGIAGFLTNGTDALILSSPTDVRQLVDLLTRIFEEPTLREAVATGARHFAAQRSWSSIAFRQELMYRDIVDMAS